MHDDTYYFVYKGGHLYVGSTANAASNGLYNKSIVNAILPVYFNGTRIYGTIDSCLNGVTTLKYVFIPRTYIIIEEELCNSSPNVESIVFEENSKCVFIGHSFARTTSITQIILPSSLKTFITANSFYDCKKLKNIVYQGSLKINDDSSLFANVPSDLVIHVSTKYAYGTFGGRSVTKDLLPKLSIALSCKRRQNFKSSLFFVSIVYVSY